MAATLHWDADANPANGAGGETGTWDTTLLNWFDGASDVTWNNSSNDDAVFGGTAGVVTTTANLKANSLAFNTGPYSLYNTGASQKLTITAGIISVATNLEANICMNITNSANATNIGVIKTGAGKLYLSRNNSFYGGLYATGGTLSLSNKFQIGATGGSLTVNGATLELTPAQASGNQTVSGRTLYIGNNGATIDVAASPFGDWSFSDFQGTNGTLTKTGAGELTFSGPGARSGPTIINAGTLRVNNTGSSSLGSGAVTVNAVGALGGVGLVAGNVSGSGAIAPGFGGAGTLMLQNGLNLTNGGTYEWELAALKDSGSGIAGSDFDQLTISGGSLVLSGSSKLSVSFTGSAAAPDPTNAFWRSNHTWTAVALGGSGSNPGSSNFSAVTNGNYAAGTFSTIVSNGNILLRFITNAMSNPTLVLSTASISVPEGGSNSFSVWLSAQPTSNVTVTTTFSSGDANLTVASGASRAFSETNWSIGQTVTLAAAEDSDTLNGQAAFAVSASGLPGQNVAATEADNDFVAPTNRPNIIVICADDQRWDSLGVAQVEECARARFPWFVSPNLDRLANEGIRFRNAFVVHSLCSPSRACMLTGRYGHLNGIVNNKTDFPTNSVTWATLLASAGYTNGYFGKWHMGSQSGQRPGFHFSASFVGQSQYSNASFEINGVTTNTVGWVDDVSTDFATNFIWQARTSSFAIFIGYKTPHGPMDPPERALNLYTNVVPNPAPNAGAVPAWDSNPTSPTTAKIRDYHRCLSGVDDNVGRLLTLLDQLNLSSNTAIIYVSDNGRYLGDHGQGDKRSAYEESMRVPLLVRYPNLVAAGSLSDRIVLNLDLAPTILDLAGVAAPTNMQGRSFKPLLAGAPPTDWRRSFFYEYFVEGGSAVPNIYCFRTETNKLITYPDHDEWKELFSLTVDSYETNNLVTNTTFYSVLTNMEATLQRQMRDLGLLSELKWPARAGNGFQFSVVGGIGPGYQIQSSTNFTSWTTLTNIEMTNVVDGLGNMPVIDAGSSPRKFYRAKQSANP